MAAFSCGVLFFFQAEDGIRDLVRSRGLGDVYKRQVQVFALAWILVLVERRAVEPRQRMGILGEMRGNPCLLYTSDAADERSSVDLGGRRIIKKKTCGNLDNDVRRTKRMMRTRSR